MVHDVVVHVINLWLLWALLHPGLDRLVSLVRRVVLGLLVLYGCLLAYATLEVLWKPIPSWAVACAAAAATWLRRLAE